MASKSEFNRREPPRLSAFGAAPHAVLEKGAPGNSSVRVQNPPQKPPFFSICIPQYSRYPFLREELEALAQQTCKDYEVCISDDYSTEQEQAASIVELLRKQGIPFVYELQAQSLRYDANLRAAMDLARGEYLVLMGNDDKFADEHILEVLQRHIVAHAPVSVVITNYKEIPSGRIFRRILRDGVVGSGVATATRTYRNYAFVSGLALRRADAIQHRTEQWDGSEMYQMYLGSRMVASGGRLLGLTQVTVLKDIQIPGLEVDSYRNRQIIRSEGLTERILPLCQIPSLVYNAVAPLAPKGQRGRIAAEVLKQMLVFTYPYWMVELRRVNGFRYAYEVCLGMRPRNLTKRMVVSRCQILIIWCLFLLSSVVGLLFPITLFGKLSPGLHALAKRRTVSAD
jgi:glycosyltransferase involved in cell wall biosynthesis